MRWVKVFVFLVTGLNFLGCSSSHKHPHPHRNPSHSDHGNYGYLDADDHHYHETEVSPNFYQELPDDPLPLFCDLEPYNGTDQDEREAGKVCQIEGGQTVFSRKPILSMGLGKGELILTIDDGPTRGLTEDIIALLRGYGIKATFFLTGNRIARHSDIVRLMYREGHTVGNHTYSHVLKKITPNTIASEILKAHQEVVNALGEEPEGRLLFRAPGLAWNSMKARNLNSNRQTRRFIGPIHANLGADAPAADWHCWSKAGGRKSARACADLYFKTIMAKKRGIVLLHDLNSKTYQMLEILLERLDQTGGIRRPGSTRGGWVFKDIQEIPFLAQFEDDGPDVEVVNVGSPTLKTPFSDGPRITVRDEDVENQSNLTDDTKIFYSGSNYLRAGDILDYQDLNRSVVIEGYKLRKIKITKMQIGLERFEGRRVYIWEKAF